MIRLILLALLPGAALAGVSYTTRTDIELLQGGRTLGHHASEQACIDAARSQPVPADASGPVEYECRKTTRVVATHLPDPPAAPISRPTTSDASAPYVNPFRPAQKRDPLDAALIRLARSAMSADLSTNEPWLFDRASTFYKLARWTGEDEFRRHAFALVEQYYSLIDARGEFTLKPGDTKYAYVDGAVWYERETGNPKFRPKAQAIHRLWLAEFPGSYSSAQAIWTEREIAYALGAALGWHELSREPQALSRARELVRQWADMSAASGAPLHTLAQHQEEFEPPWAAKRMTSPWMAALFFEYLQHYHRITGERLALELVSRYADFLLANCLYDGSENHPNLTGYLLPYYLCGENRSFYARETPSEGDGEHTPDVMGILAFAVNAKRALGLDPARALQAYRKLRESAEFFVGRRNDVNPPRKINWWIASSYDSTRLVE